MKNIVVLDGATLNPGDCSWSELEALGPCTVYDRTPPAKTVDRAKDAEIVLTNKTRLERGAIERLPALEYIGLLSTGCNAVDLDAARERGVPVTNVPAYGTESVAQLTFAHILNLVQRVAHHAQTVRDGRWSASDDFCYWDTPLIELSGLTLGVVGAGRIGRATARIARAFQMRVVAFDEVARADASETIEFASSLTDVVKAADILSLHCPLTDGNRRLVNAELLAMMKPSAFLINTSRGGLIDEQALADALNAGRIAGAGLDVLDEEPPAGGSPLFTAKNCFVTPHIAWATLAARRRLMAVAVDNVRSFLEGDVKNRVN